MAISTRQPVQPPMQQATILSDGQTAVVTAKVSEQEARAIAFFQHSVGSWQSRRRYYTLANDQTQEVVSDLSISFLEADHAELIELGQRHDLEMPMICGAKVTWESTYISPSKKPSVGETVFGIRGDVMYRDRGFATPKPVTAQYRFTGDRTMVLHTEYGGSTF
ncbi:MAG: phycobiliprotein lyase, partial [Phormidesmis sp.]